MLEHNRHRIGVRIKNGNVMVIPTDQLSYIHQKVVRHKDGKVEENYKIHAQKLFIRVFTEQIDRPRVNLPRPNSDHPCSSHHRLQHPQSLHQTNALLPETKIWSLKPADKITS